MKRKKGPGEYMLFVVIILLISLVVNVFNSIDNSKYKYKVSKASYKNIEDIRSRNEKNIVILQESIDAALLTNQDLLTLYKNYTSISSCMISLWDEYSFYTDNEWSLTKKEIDTTKVLSNEVSGRIGDYLGLLLEEEMETQLASVEIKGETLEKFETMKMLANDIKVFYDTFYEKQLGNTVDEEREKKVIKKSYWIDMLEGINNISEEYGDYNFAVK